MARAGEWRRRSVRRSSPRNSSSSQLAGVTAARARSTSSSSPSRATSSLPRMRAASGSTGAATLAIQKANQAMGRAPRPRRRAAGTDPEGSGPRPSVSLSLRRRSRRSPKGSPTRATHSATATPLTPESAKTTRRPRKSPIATSTTTSPSRKGSPAAECLEGSFDVRGALSGSREVGAKLTPTPPWQQLRGGGNRRGHQGHLISWRGTWRR